MSSNWEMRACLDVERKLTAGGVDVGDVLGAGGAVVKNVVHDVGVGAREGEHGGLDELELK